MTLPIRSSRRHRLATGSIVAGLVLTASSAADLAAQQPVNAAGTQVAGATPAAAQPAPRASWYMDRRTWAPGDVVSIIIDEFTLVAAGASDRAIDRRRGEGLLTIFPSSRNGLSVRGRDESDVRGTSTRDDRLRTEVSVRIAEVSPSGTLRLEGRKLITIDKHEQEFVFRGWARPQDILANNVIEGWRVADLELLYVSNGELKKPKKGLISRLLGIIF